MTTRVLSFGNYQFDDAVMNFRDNFTNLVPRTIRLPGLTGGYSEYGTKSPPPEIGRVSFTHMLTADSPSEMRAKIDAIRALAGAGMQRLTVLPHATAEPRFCFAYLNNAPINENVIDRTDRQLPVPFDFQAPDPRWYSTGTDDSPAWGAFNWGDGSLWGGSEAPQDLSGVSNDLMVIVGGNAPTPPRLSVMTYAGQTVTNPTFQRIVNGHVVDEVKYTGTLGENKTLWIDCRAFSVRLQSLPAYTSAFSYLRPEWFELMPGSNTVRVRFANSGDAAKVRVTFFDAWY